MLKPYYKIISESDRPFPDRILQKNPFMDTPVLYPIVKADLVPEPLQRRHPPALPLIKKLEKIFVKQPPVKTTGTLTNRRLRLAKAKAKARIRKIKLLAI